ncbi:MAG: spermidine synthase [Beutenbergiaceae bacterium]
MVELRADSDGVMVLIDGIESSHLDLEDPSHLVFEYMQQMMAVLQLAHTTTQRLQVLHLGGAGCALARAIDAHWPQPRQLVFEIDALLAQYVRQWFTLPRSPRLRIRVGDARTELDSLTPQRFDVVVRDAFQGREVPDHLRTQEFTHAVQRALTPTGIYLANLADSPPLRLARREAATISAVFDHVIAIAEPGVLRGRRYGNVVLAASQAPVQHADLSRALRSLPVPAALVSEQALPDFIAGERPLRDPSPDNETGPHYR